MKTIGPVGHKSNQYRRYTHPLQNHCFRIRKQWFIKNASDVQSDLEANRGPLGFLGQSRKMVSGVIFKKNSGRPKLKF